MKSYLTRVWDKKIRDGYITLETRVVILQIKIHVTVFSCYLFISLQIISAISHNSLPYSKILAQSELKQIAEDKLNVAQNIIFSSIG